MPVARTEMLIETVTNIQLICPLAPERLIYIYPSDAHNVVPLKASQSRKSPV